MRDCFINPYGIYSEKDIKKYKIDIPIHNLVSIKSLSELANIFNRNNWNFKEFSEEIRRLKHL